jgi:chromosome segregation protein
VLLDLDVSLEDVFQMFNSDDSARAVLITPSKTRKNLKSQKQISGAIPALDVVKLPASGGDVLEILLSNVFIVENRREALGIISQLDTNSRVVTKAGEVFWGNGLMALGKEKRTSVVSRSRQIREMQEQLHQTQSAIDELDSQIRKQEGELEGLRAEINNQKGKLRQIQQVLEEKNQQATQLNLKVEKLRQSVVWKINQISLLESQLLNGEEEVSALEVVLTALERDSEQAGQKLKELNDQMRSLPLDDLQAQVGHWTTSQAVTARALNDSLRRIAEHTERIEGNRQRQLEEREK